MTGNERSGRQTSRGQNRTHDKREGRECVGKHLLRSLHLSFTRVSRSRSQLRCFILGSDVVGSVFVALRHCGFWYDRGFAASSHSEVVLFDEAATCTLTDTSGLQPPLVPCGSRDQPMAMSVALLC